MATLRTLVAYVEDKPGVLNRVASLFRRRGYNIASLNVGRTHEAGVSRMTIVVEGDAGVAQLMEGKSLQVGQRACPSRTSRIRPLSCETWHSSKSRYQPIDGPKCFNWSRFFTRA